MNALRAGLALAAALTILCLPSSNVASSPAAARTTLSVKGFVSARSGQLLEVDRGDHVRFRVLLMPETRVIGARTLSSEIAVHDLVNAEGAVVGERTMEAAFIDVVLTAAGIGISTRRSGLGSIFWNWVLNRSLMFPVK